ncbi:MAG: amidohydrolase family protein [Rhodoglobus sp.]
MSFPVIDAHQHVWDPDVAEYDWLVNESPVINRAIGFDELEPELASAGVDFTVLVESADNAEDTQLMVDTAARHPQVAAIVGWAPLEVPQRARATIERHAADPLMVGVRTLIHNQADPDWLLRDGVDESLSMLESAGLTFDVVAVLPRHLELVPIIAERHPGLRIVIDHLSKPPIGLSEREPWWSLIAEAAAHPLVFAKVSGLYSATADPASWTTHQIRPFFDRALEAFGAGRLMYGGDWPISLLAGGYARVWNGLMPLLDELSPDEREHVLGRTAGGFYRIDPARLTL